MIVLGIIILFLALCLSALAVRLVHVERARDRYKAQWRDSLTQRFAEDYLIHEWANRDLMPEWEDAYPHVVNMPDDRKYSEWATFCANYPTREQMIAQIALDGSHRKARAASRGE